MADEKSALGGLFGASNPVGGVVSAVSGIAGTIAGIADMKKRREMEQALAMLSATQRRQLDEKLLQVDDENEKIRILTESMTQYLIENSKSAGKKDLYLYLAAGGLALVLLVSVVVLSVKSKKM